MIANGLVDGALVHGIEGLWRKSQAFSVASERTVQLRRALSEQSSGLEISTHKLANDRRRLQVDKLEQVLGHLRKVPYAGAQREHALEVPRHLVERVAPRIAFVGYETVQNCDRHGLLPCSAVFERAGQRRDILKRRALRKEATDLELRILAFAAAPEELQDEVLSIQDACVALVCTNKRRAQRV